MPAYPESARRQGVEGVATLRFQVHTDGSVTEMSVVRSAGHLRSRRGGHGGGRKWRFEPARRGKDAVVVWVTLPVRFELKRWRRRDNEGRDPSPLGRQVAAAWAVIGGTAPVARAVAAQSLWDDPAFALYRQAVEAMEAKDFARASTLADEAIKAYPDNILAYYLRGQAALAERRWPDAATAFAKVVALYPGSFAGQRDLATALQQAGRTRRGGARLRGGAHAQARQRGHPAAPGLPVRQRQADRTGPEPLLQSLADRGTKAYDVYTTLARIAYEKDDFAGSEAAFVKALAVRDDGKTWFNLGVVRVRRERSEGGPRGLRACREARRDQGAGGQRDREGQGGAPEVIGRGVVAVAWLVAASLVAAQPAERAQTILHMLDYVAVDYPEFVRDGKVLDQSEYDEQLEFVTQVRALLEHLAARPERGELLARADRLVALVKDKRPGAGGGGSRRPSCAGPSSRPTAWRSRPSARPISGRRAALYTAQCAACHGATGRGDGPAGQGLDPRPSNFHDRRTHGPAERLRRSTAPSPWA